MTENGGVNPPWFETVEKELRRYSDEFDTNTITLEELYNFSEDQIAQQYPQNQNIRAKIREQLQLLRDQGKVEFVDEQGTYRITIDSTDKNLPALSTDVFELLQGTPEDKKDANDRFKRITEALEEVLRENPKFEDFVWPSVGRKNGSPYTSRPNQQPGRSGVVEYREYCWLGVAHREYRERFERPQDGVQFQFSIRTETGSARPPADIALHLDANAESDLRNEIRSNLQDNREEFLDRVRALSSFEVALGTDIWTGDQIETDWQGFIDGLDEHLRIYYPLTEEEIQELGTDLVPKIEARFEELLPLYSLVSGIELSTPMETPSVWIEKTSTRGRPYKQEGDYALGKALMSPSRDEAGRKRYETMREADIGDIVIHFLQDQSEIAGVSVIDSELIEDFHNPPHDRWTAEQEERGGYLRWLRDYRTLESSIQIYDDILQNPQHESTLRDIRERYENIVYTKNLSLNQGHYFTRCPEELGQILVTESPGLAELLQANGYDTEPVDHPNEGYWHMVFTKRQKATEFLANPSIEAFFELVDADHFWGSMAYQNWPNELFEEHTPEEVATAVEDARESGDLTPLLNLHQMGVSKATELLRAVEPDEYAILNKRSRKGMEILGYEPPSGSPSAEEYRTFTEQVREAHDEFALRELMEREMDERIPTKATKLEVADWAFYVDFEGQISLSDLTLADRYEYYSSQLAVSFDDIELDPSGLHFDDWERIESRVNQALREGSHILLFGPPGTGKTKLAREICEASVGRDQFELVTGSADWSTFDTIGGYQSTRDQGLRFEPGVILERFRRDEQGTPANEWLIIDELNRADIDKAFGALFSALTGESVTLPFKHENGENIQILDSTQDDLTVRPHRYYIPEDWRMISTMNTLDKTSLYEMSYAFMRRWAFIPVGMPDFPDPDVPNWRDQLAGLVRAYVDVWADEPEFDEEQLAKIGVLWYEVNKQRDIGPAIVEDIYQYVSGTSDGADPDYISPIVMYVFPQLEGLRQSELKGVIDGLEGVLEDPQDLRDTAEDFFQTDLTDDSGQ